MSKTFESMIKQAIAHALKRDDESVMSVAIEILNAATGILYGTYGLRRTRDILLIAVNKAVEAINVIETDERTKGAHSMSRKNRTAPQTHAELELTEAINKAKRAYFADSCPKAMADAIEALLEALGQPFPDCTCNDHGTPPHTKKCDCYAWEHAGETDE